MDQLDKVALSEAWKQWMEVALACRKPVGILAPMVSAERYEADRREAGHREVTTKEELPRRSRERARQAAPTSAPTSAPRRRSLSQM